MNGTLIKRPRKNGEPSWGYSFFAGRDGAGKRLQITKSGFTTKRQASEALRQAIEECLGKPHAKPAPLEMTFADWMERWLVEFAARTASPKTLQSMQEQSRYLVRELGETKLVSLSPLQVETALHRIQDCGGHPTKVHPKGRPLAGKTARHVAFLFLKCLRKAVGLGLIPRLPISDDYQPPKANSKKPLVVDRERLSQLLTRHSGSPFFPLLVLAAATVCRRGELLAFTWADIDFESGILSVSKSLEETDAGVRVKSTKSGRPRRFVVPAEALEVLKEHRIEQDRERALFGSDYEDHGLVFCKRDGAFHKPDKVSVRITKMAKKAGLTGLGLHSLRHAHATELLSKGTPIAAVASRLGHANSNVTLSIYNHALPADELTAAKIWNDSLADVIECNRKGRRSRMLANVSTAEAQKPVKIR